MNSTRAARAVIEAIRLDLWSAGEVDRRVDEGLEAGVGGFVLFGGEAERVARLTSRARSDAARDLWIAADLERGAGQQFRGLTELPPPAALAHHDDPLAAAERAAAVTATDALSVGVNWVLAPVLDIDAERDNPIIATRSFGADPGLVTALGRRWIETCQERGALACAKHFPGHGRSLTDSHAELPIIPASRAALADDLMPFRLVNNGVGSVMVAHVAYPALGSDRPATLSPEIVTGILREDIGFGGLVATDAMIMAGVGDESGAPAVQAMRAGCDVILYPSDLATTVESLAREADADPDFADRLSASVALSETMLRAFRGSNRITTPPPKAAEPGAIELAVQTIVDRSAGTAGWDPTAATSIVAISDDPELGPPAGREGPLGAVMAGRLEAAGWTVEVASSSPRPGSAEQVLVVLAATPRGWKGYGGVSEEAAEAVRRAMASSDRALLVLLGHARWLDDLGSAGIGAWSTESLMEHAAAVWLDRECRRTASSGATA